MAPARSEKKQTGRIITTDGFGLNGSILLCPNCGEQCLHHEGITVFDRGEDQEQLTRTRVFAGMVASHLVRSERTDNPSARQDGVIISFSCELCDADPIELTISQHNGSTLLGWRYTTHPQLME